MGGKSIWRRDGLRRWWRWMHSIAFFYCISCFTLSMVYSETGYYCSLMRLQAWTWGRTWEDQTEGLAKYGISKHLFWRSLNGSQNIRILLNTHFVIKTWSVCRFNIWKNSMLIPWSYLGEVWILAIFLFVFCFVTFRFFSWGREHIETAINTNTQMHFGLIYYQDNTNLDTDCFHNRVLLWCRRKSFEVHPDNANLQVNIKHDRLKLFLQWCLPWDHQDNNSSILEHYGHNQHKKKKIVIRCSSRTGQDTRPVTFERTKLPYKHMKAHTETHNPVPKNKSKFTSWPALWNRTCC